MPSSVVGALIFVQCTVISAVTLVECRLVAQVSVVGWMGTDSSVAVLLVAVVSAFGTVSLGTL